MSGILFVRPGKNIALHRDLIEGPGVLDALELFIPRARAFSGSDPSGRPMATRDDVGIGMLVDESAGVPISAQVVF
ncbi:MAG: hypothetical protein MZV70_49435 [Desulfobacterales bacterium]|nr:hypothetical protein [Desulfobacterales bacterium]